MNSLLVLALVCTLCVAGIGAVYFVWVRKRTRRTSPRQPEQK